MAQAQPRNDEREGLQTALRCSHSSLLAEAEAKTEVLHAGEERLAAEWSGCRRLTAAKRAAMRVARRGVAMAAGTGWRSLAAQGRPSSCGLGWCRCEPSGVRYLVVWWWCLWLWLWLYSRPKSGPTNLPHR